MKITNNNFLPEPIYKALSAYNYPPQENRIGVTDLVGPAMIRHLKMKHWDELEEDASDRIWALFGTAVAGALEKQSVMNHFSEQKIGIKIGDIQIVGKFDDYDINPDKRNLSDYKATGGAAFFGGVKKEWECQLNVYSYILTHLGLPPKELTIHAILRDWMRSKTQGNNDYPPKPFITMDVKQWDRRMQHTYIIDRLIAHKNPKPCTPEERWGRPDIWAVKKKGSNRAVNGGLHTTEEDAEKFKNKKCVDAVNALTQKKTKKLDEFEIEKRPGLQVRCEDFCPVRAVCPHKEIK